VKVKICGITNPDDALFAAESGADMLGFIFASSKRQIDEKKAESICSVLDKKSLRSKIICIGVFVNQDAPFIDSFFRKSLIDYAQIHGDETPDFCNSLQNPWYRALRIKNEETLNTTLPSVLLYQCPIILADTLSDKGYGGTGEIIEIDTAIAMQNEVKKCGKQFFIAGGITPENISDIIHKINPDGVDISSGVEELPGKKSHEKIKKLFDAIRQS
jgi:phosphoribosylanthranilate isomerase